LLRDKARVVGPAGYRNDHDVERRLLEEGLALAQHVVTEAELAVLISLYRE